jgi:hypothetical protein
MSGVLAGFASIALFAATVALAQVHEPIPSESQSGPVSSTAVPYQPRELILIPSGERPEGMVHGADMTDGPRAGARPARNARDDRLHVQCFASVELLWIRHVPAAMFC